jgi:hypothetical protein
MRSDFQILGSEHFILLEMPLLIVTYSLVFFFFCIRYVLIYNLALTSSIKNIFNRVFKYFLQMSKAKKFWCLKRPLPFLIFKSVGFLYLSYFLLLY